MTACRSGGALSLRELRRGMQMVFQDSYASLNPRLTIEESIAFGPKVHGMADAASRALARELLGKVGLRPENFANRYPHEISGGQRQRVNIARALALSPRLVILDEAVSALDKSVEAQVLNLLVDLKREFGLTYLFISHDLNVVRYISDRVLVMYLGEVVELGPVDQVWDAPAHPYTRALLAAMPSSDPDKRTETPPISGDPPNPIDPPAGCRFHTRCPFAEPLCANATPKLTALDRMGHQAACYMAIPGSGHQPRTGKGSGRRMTKPTAKEIKAMADVTGVPVDAEVAARIANSIGPAFEGFAPVAGTLPFDLEPATYLVRAVRQEGRDMSTEPALMSLTSVAKAIAEKRVSSREVTQSCLDRIAQWQPRLNAFMAIEARRGAGGGRHGRCGAREGQQQRRASRRAAGAQGHVLRRRQGGHLRLQGFAAISSRPQRRRRCSG